MVHLPLAVPSGSLLAINPSGQIISTSTPNGWDSLTDMTLAQGNFYVGNASNNPVATSTIYLTSDGRIGIGTNNPASFFPYSGMVLVNNGGLKSDWVNVTALQTAQALPLYHLILPLYIITLNIKYWAQLEIMEQIVFLQLLIHQ